MKLLLLAAAAASTSTLVAAQSTCYEGFCPASSSASACDSSLTSISAPSGEACCATTIDCTNPGATTQTLCSQYSTMFPSTKKFYYFILAPASSCTGLTSADSGYTAAKSCTTSNCNNFEFIAGSAPAPSPSTASPAASSGSTASPAAATGEAGSTASPAASPTASTASKCYEGACLSTTDSSSCQNTLVEVPSQGACCVFTIDCTNAAQHSGTSAATYCGSFSGKINYYIPMQTVQQCKQFGSSDSTGLITGAGGCTSDDCNNAASTGKVLASSNGAAGAVTAAKHVGAAALAAGVLGAALAA